MLFKYVPITATSWKWLTLQCFVSKLSLLLEWLERITSQNSKPMSHFPRDQSHLPRKPETPFKPLCELMWQRLSTCQRRDAIYKWFRTLIIRHLSEKPVAVFPEYRWLHCKFYSALILHSERSRRRKGASLFCSAMIQLKYRVFTLLSGVVHDSGMHIQLPSFSSQSETGKNAAPVKGG